MTEGLIDSQWSRLAKDDGTLSLKHFEYDAVIGGESAAEITTTPTNIGYSPSVNKAKDITIDVPPLTSLEDLTYLGEPIKLYVDQELAFDGEIKEIQTQQKEGGDYSIIGKPYGKRLKGSDIETTVNNEIVSDTTSLLVDRFNSYDNDHETMADGKYETLNNVTPVGGNVREARGSPATATYSGVGLDLSAVTSIYVKAYVPSNETLTLNAIATSTTDTKTISGLDKNSYGEWVRFSGFSNVAEEYDLEFQLDLDSSLINWISVVDEEVKSETTSPDVQVVDANLNFYSWSDSQLETNANITGNGMVFDGSGRPQTRQVTEWATSPFPIFGDDQFVGGDGGRVAVGEFTSSWDMSPSDSLDNWDIYARVKPFEIFVNRTQEHTNGNTPYDYSWGTNASASTTQAAVNNTSVEVTGDANKSFQWDYDRTNQVGKLDVSSQVYLPNSGTIEWVIEDGNDNGYGIGITSNELRLIRKDTGNTNVLQTDTAYTPQTGEWFNIDIIVDDTTDDIKITLDDSSGSYVLAATDTTHSVFSEFQVYTTRTHYLDDMFARVGGSIKNISITTSINSNTLSYGLDMGGTNYRDVGWIRIASHDFSSDYPTSLSGSISIDITAQNGSETGFGLSPLVAVHEKSNWSTSDFDLSLHQAQGHLDYPSIYANGDVFDNTVTFNEEISQENITESTVSSTITNTTNVSSSWGISQVIDTSSTDFPPPSNSSSDTQGYAYPGVQHIVKATLTASGSRDTASPRKGFNRQRLDDFSVTISTNDLEVLYEQDISDNRLSVLNSLAGESSVLFRWEGDTVKIFHIGQETTNPTLRSENITSSVSIEDVYRYCEVIGLHDARSGVIESQNAPAYIDEKMVIRDDSIESESDAKSRARQFLSEHGSIKFKGDIQTMPTFAPLGAKIDGSVFNHGQDMIINGVRYGKRKTRITLGYDKNIASELISLQKSSSDTKSRETGKGMKVPVGEGQI